MGDSPLFLAGIAAITTAGSLVLLLRFAQWFPHALPGPRSLHVKPIPRVGGIAIWAGFVPVLVVTTPPVPERWPIWVAAWALIVGISLADDWRGLSPLYRLAAHVIGAIAITLALMLPIDGAADGFVALAATLLIVWAANLYNFMDGSDGIAAAMGAIGFAAYGLAAFAAGASFALYFALATSTLVFLTVNLPPARIFMGDVGAVPMGFLAAAFALAGWRMHAWPAWFPLLVFLPFVADATVTLGKRLLRRERVWEAHRGHYYQRLHQLGAGHPGTLFFFGALMVGTATSALLTLAIDPAVGWLITAAWVIALGAVFSGIDYHWRNRSTQ